MNKKIKLLTSTLCGVILASSLSFMNVQAAPAQNNAKAGVASLSSNSIVPLSPALSKTGMLYWTPQEKAVNYSYQIYYQTAPYMNSHMGGGDTGGDSYINLCYNFDNSSVWTHKNSDYKLILKALDSNNNVINTATIYFYYDGTTFTQK